MVFDYFSFARAKKNKEDLEKTNPQNPVLKDEDEQFLHRVASQDVPAAPFPPSIIKDDGTEQLAQSQDLKEAGEAAGTVALPAVSESEDADLIKGPEATDEAVEQAKPSETTETAEATASTDAKQATEAAASTDANVDQAKSPKRTWASYVPSVPSVTGWRSKAAEKAPESVKDKVAPKDEKSAEDTTSSEDATTKDDTITSAKTEDKGKAPATAEEDKVDEKLADAYPPGVKVTENIKLDEEKKEQDEKEVSVLLDRMNLSSINNRVFSFSDKSQKLYEDFTVVLKDVINGGPTAYKDMEKLLRDNESHLSEMFNNMPPFVQTLVKSLPAKLGGSLGPEILAAASEKPGADMKTRMAAASKSPPTSPNSKKKRGVPSVKTLANEKGAVASTLKSIVTFLQTRFPAIITGTNVIMSLAVFILLFVFWYCHKRGREERLLKEHEASDVESGLDESEILTPDSDRAELEKETGEASTSREDSMKAAQDVLNQPEPAEVPLPSKDDETELHGDKATKP